MIYFLIYRFRDIFIIYVIKNFISDTLESLFFDNM